MSIGTFGNIYSDELITATELNRQPADQEHLKVVVYYAGKHPNFVPTPHNSCQ